MMSLIEMFENKNNSKCPFCGKLINPETEFRDSLSKREFEISGLCQSCQDNVFGE